MGPGLRREDYYHPEFLSAVAIALIESWMPSRDARVGLAGAVALEQLDLEQVQRLDIGQAQADRGVELGFFSSSRDCPVIASRQSWVRCHSSRMRVKIASRRRLVLDQLGVARGDPHVGLGEHHLEIVERGAEERPGLAHLAQQRDVAERRPAPGRRRTSPAASPAPAPS